MSSTASLRTNVEALTLIDNDVRRLIDLDAGMDDGEKQALRHSQPGLIGNADTGSDNVIHVEHSLLLREANALSFC